MLWKDLLPTSCIFHWLTTFGFITFPSNTPCYDALSNIITIIIHISSTESAAIYNFGVPLVFCTDDDLTNYDGSKRRQHYIS